MKKILKSRLLRWQALPIALHPQQGLCGQLESMLTEGFLDWVVDINFHEDLLKSYIHYSGERTYPVSHPDFSPAQAYYDALRSHTMDRGTYGIRRLDLASLLQVADFTIKTNNLNALVEFKLPNAPVGEQLFADETEN